MSYLLLNDQLVDLVDLHKYLGVTMTSDRQDHMDISRSIRALYIRGNSLISNFKHGSDDVKVQLFKSYCTRIYIVAIYGLILVKTFTEGSDPLLIEFLFINEFTSSHQYICYFLAIWY